MLVAGRADDSGGHPDGAMRSSWVVRAYAEKAFDSIHAMGEYLKEQRLGKDGRA